MPAAAASTRVPVVEAVTLSILYGLVWLKAL
jgi:hypothetical protein